METEELTMKQRDELKATRQLLRVKLARRYKGGELRRMLRELSADMRKAQRLKLEAERFSEECAGKWSRRLEGEL